MQLYVTKAIRRGIVALWLLVLGTVLAYVIGSRLAPLTGHHLIVIRGASMEPAIPLGSLVALRPVPADEVRPGDVVTMQLRNDTLVTHRVLRVAELADGPHLETKGDNNAEPDPVLVPAASALGVVAVEVPYAGFLVAFLSIPTGMVSAVSFLTSLLCMAALLEPPKPVRPPVRIALGAPLGGPVIRTR